MTKLLRRRVAQDTTFGGDSSENTSDEALDSNGAAEEVYDGAKEIEEESPFFSLVTTDAKCVRRDEIYSSTSSTRSSPDPALAELLRKRVAQDISFEFSSPRNNVDGVLGGTGRNEDEEEEELEFHLFAPEPDSKSAKPPAKRIRINSPERTVNSGFVIAERPQDYYFITEANETRLAQLNATAISGEEVLKRSRARWPGCEVPWRVKEISSKGLAKEVVAGHRILSTNDVVQKRKRPGKKMRIALREKAKEIEMKKAVAEKKKAEAEKIEQEKEKAQREKKARKNREKKLKKRARDRDKVKKMAASGDTTGGAIEDMDS